jgi:hypothetical protein
MSYILNLTLGCWITLDGNIDSAPHWFSSIESKKDLTKLINVWNSARNVWPEVIHYPALPEHFEVYSDAAYEKVTATIGGNRDKTKVSKD